jgi:hypothetical protein
VAIRPYFDQINECTEGARREAAYISTGDMVSIPTPAKFLHKIFYGAAIPAVGLCIVVLFGHQPASRYMANATVDVGALEATIDIKHLPRQDVSSEAY